MPKIKSFTAYRLLALGKETARVDVEFHRSTHQRLGSKRPAKDYQIFHQGYLVGWVAAVRAATNNNMLKEGDENHG